MRDFVSVDRDANQIRMRRSLHKGSFLLVEGGSDKTFYGRFVDKSECELVIISGKPSSKLRVIAVLKILEESNFRGVLAIVDADFDRVSNTINPSPNLLYTDTHDLETMLMRSPALDKVIAEYGSEEKILEFNRDVRETLVEIGVSIGCLLWISQVDKLNLKFEGITFSKFVNEKRLMIDELKLIREIKNKSQAFKLQDEYLQQRLIEQKNLIDDPWQVCCGHNLVEILSLSLRQTIGSNNPTDVKALNLERNLRLAYEEVYFQSTQLYFYIERWESNNQPFKVLLRSS
ncbi:MAG: DUF4435 domain-containing protein [Jaaginema sp. PMC 1079.18]|nr:DUF4435 domain-containing protein [Jaaginema sp. PMC 1080.18]MEC4851792.1 DUF4435 domain-containing protein [Jaaginema sp. PMC 1079.18]MEC4867622.1 DUF4435 domain-containing protein [Jaaginema sp. PMC 1078.18]